MITLKTPINNGGFRDKQTVNPLGNKILLVLGGGFWWSNLVWLFRISPAIVATSGAKEDHYQDERIMIILQHKVSTLSVIFI